MIHAFVDIVPFWVRLQIKLLSQLLHNTRGLDDRGITTPAVFDDRVVASWTRFMRRAFESRIPTKVLERRIPCSLTSSVSQRYCWSVLYNKP